MTGPSTHTASAPAPRSSVPAAALPLGMLCVLGALSAFGPLSTDMYLPGLPAMARGLHTSESTIQLTLSSCLVGLAVGQLLAGPLSDALGRRRPLLAGLLAFVLASAICAPAPSLGVLLALRFVQGMAGSAGIAIARAIVRDRTDGIAAARVYALLMVVTGLGPIFAPVAGGLLLHVTDWRGIFLALAAIGIAILAASALLVPETLAPAERHRGGLATTRAAFGTLARDRRYVANVFAGSFSAAALLAWVSGAPFVLEHIHHLSPQLFSFAFAANGAGIIVARQLASRYVGRVGPARVMLAGNVCQAAGTIGALGFTLTDPALGPLLVCIFISISSVGAIMPMAIALAMQDHPERAGSASGLLGFTQFTLGSAAAPLVGIAGTATALPLAITMCCGACASAASSLTLRRLSGSGAGSAPGAR